MLPLFWSLHCLFGTSFSKHNPSHNIIMLLLKSSFELQALSSFLEESFVLFNSIDACSTWQKFEIWIFQHWGAQWCANLPFLEIMQFNDLFLEPYISTSIGILFQFGSFFTWACNIMLWPSFTIIWLPSSYLRYEYVGFMSGPCMPSSWAFKKLN